MTVQVRVRSGTQRIVPVRFARAVTGPPLADAPDVDDRGFNMGTRPGSWGHANVRGAMVGIAQGDTVRVRVVREDIDDTAPLFVTSTDTDIVTVEDPPGGGPIPPSGVFEIKGIADRRNRPVALEVRLGSVEGPVLGELEPHIFRLRRLRVLAHLVRINGVATARTAASLAGIFNAVNAIWRPAGIRVVTPVATRVTAVNGFATPGQVTTNVNGVPPSWNEFSRLINTRYSTTRINVYCVRAANEWRGLTYDRDIPRNNVSGGYGIVLVDGADANDFAHELGHYLDLDRHADEVAPPTFRQDIWARRRLMFRFNPYGAAVPAFRNNVGYGALRRGALISVKDVLGDANDGELARARRRTLNPY